MANSAKKNLFVLSLSRQFWEVLTQTCSGPHHTAQAKEDMTDKWLMQAGEAKFIPL